MALNQFELIFLLSESRVLIPLSSILIKFEIFKKLIKSGSIVRALVTKNTKDKPRSFFDRIDNWAKESGSLRISAYPRGSIRISA